MKNSSVEAVIEHWRAHDVPHLPGVRDDELTAFENKHAVKLPEDVRSLYRTTDGTRVPLYNGCDLDGYEFYRLSDLEPDAQYPWAIVFADYLMLSWWFAIDLTGAGGQGAGAVYLLGAVGGRPLVVAHSFSEFLELYVHDDERIWPDGAKTYHESTAGPRS